MRCIFLFTCLFLLFCNVNFASTFSEENETDTEYALNDTIAKPSVMVEDTLVQMPNAFIPNSRRGEIGINDIFRAVYVPSSTRQTSIAKFEMFIYNRMGELLFLSKSISNGWNGYVKGQLCPIGIYVYVIRYIIYEIKPDGSPYATSHEKKGSFMLLE